MSDGDARSWYSSARQVDAAKPGGGSDAVVAVRSWPTLPAAVHGEDAGHRGRLARAAAEGRAGHAGAAKRATAPAVQEEGATSSDGIRRRQHAM